MCYGGSEAPVVTHELHDLTNNTTVRHRILWSLLHQTDLFCRLTRLESGRSPVEVERAVKTGQFVLISWRIWEVNLTDLHSKMYNFEQNNEHISTIIWQIINNNIENNIHYY